MTCANQTTESDREFQREATEIKILEGYSNFTSTRGNRTPGSNQLQLAGSASEVSQLILTHIPRGNHVPRSCRGSLVMAAKGKTRTAPTLEFRPSVIMKDSDHTCVVRIFVGPS